MACIKIKLDIPRARLMKYYQGRAQSIVASTGDGRTVSFPIQSIRPFVSHYGVRGEFQIRFDHQHRMIDIQAL